MSIQTSKLEASDFEGYKAIIFDFDGVISESVEIKTEAFRDMYTLYGKEVSDKVVDHHLKNGGMSRFEKIPFYHRSFLGKDLSKSQIVDLSNKFSNLVIKKVAECPLVKGSLSLLSLLYREKLLFISTGTPEKEINQILKKRKLNKYFIEILGSPSSKEDHIKTILRKYKLKKTDILFIGDAETDMKAAETFHINFILRKHNLNFNLTRNFNGKIIDDLSLKAYIDPMIKGSNE